MLRERLGSLGVPVAMGIPSGHIADNLELPLGTVVVLDSDAAAMELGCD